MLLTKLRHNSANIRMIIQSLHMLDDGIYKIFTYIRNALLEIVFLNTLKIPKSRIGD